MLQMIGDVVEQLVLFKKIKAHNAISVPDKIKIFVFFSDYLLINDNNNSDNNNIGNDNTRIYK